MTDRPAQLDYSTEKPISPVRELLTIALPTVAQMASYTVMQFLDTLILARLGTAPPTAMGNGGMLAFCFISFGMGTLFIVNTLVSQDFGAGKLSRCGGHLWQGVWFAVLYSAAMAPLTIWVPHFFERLGHSADLAPMEATYCRVLMLTMGIKLTQTALSQFMLGTNRPNWVMISAIAGVAVNAVTAYFLVLGWLDVPPMGIYGAAIAQVVGTVVELVILGIATFQPARWNEFGLGNWRFDWSDFKKLITVGFGTGVQFVVDVSAWTAFGLVVIGQFGENAMAASTFAFRYLVVSFLPVMGVSQAVTALVGRYIGARDFNAAARRAHLGYMVSLVYLVICGFIYVVFAKQLIGFFSIDPEVIRVGTTLMIFAAIYQFFDAMFIVYNGGLRGAGDTFVPAVITAAMCWSITVTGGYFFGKHFPQFGAAGPWTIATIYGVLLGAFMFWRFHRGKWREIRLEP